ncbi:hypothetical protein F443_19892 [Phytophthora nicotianae P1569]|uniref:Uncharacterized protein n=1 Tax=Phytophthora nicotianae P1569 TaxID=1317065 RepID=V9E2W2_PHYNI|nr:hypothetical protein F443_19892 [Phytophthora nicotianae P1569]
MSDEESEWVAPPSVTEESSDSEFSYDSSSPSEGAQAALSQPRPSSFTRVASYDAYAAAKEALDDHNGFVYTFESRYETTTLLVRVFLCRSHQMCGHRLKIGAVDIGNSVIQFHLEEGGRHTLVVRRARRRGIHISLREDVDSLLKMGWGATRLRTLLQHRYIDHPRMSTNIPTVRQIENRRAYLVRSCNATWEITNHVTFNAWASDRMCTTREDFMSVTDDGDAEMDSRIILDSFVIGGGSEGDPTSFGIIVSSRRVFRNVLASVRGQPGELSCATDGTYKLHFAGWVIVDCGSEHVAWSRGSFAHKFVPWAYMFVRSESKEAYTRLFCVIRERARTFFDIDVDVASFARQGKRIVCSRTLRCTKV